MTKEEAKKMLTNTKVYVNGKSKEIQEKLLEIGFSWFGVEGVRGLDYPFLYLNDKYIKAGCTMDNFFEDNRREISAEEILNIKIDEKFKDGDIISSNNITCVYRGTTSLIIAPDEVLTDCYCHKVFEFINLSLWVKDGVGCIKDFHLATYKEKEQFVNVLKKNGFKYNEETKKVEKIEPSNKKYEFKPFDKVLVRDFKDDKWQIDFFEKINEDDKEFSFGCLSEDWIYCIPYEENEDLVGTDKTPNDW